MCRQFLWIDALQLKAEVYEFFGRLDRLNDAQLEMSSERHWDRGDLLRR